MADEDADPTSYVLSLTAAADGLRRAGEAPGAYVTATDKAVYGPMLTLSEFKLRL